MALNWRTTFAWAVFSLTVPQAGASGAYEIIHSFEASPNYPYGAVIQGADGSFYGTTTVSGSNPNGDGAIFRLGPTACITGRYTGSMG